MQNIKATIITIGDELLIGQTIDTNSAWMAKQLNEIGIEVFRRVAVADKEEDIRVALDEEISRASIILITGGLGPTSDDITKPFLCKYFGGKMIVDERVLEHVHQLFAIRNRPFLEINSKQAEVPDVCTVLFNEVGTAPGMLFEKDGKWIISMPGVPFEMQGIINKEVLPRLKAHFRSDVILHRHIITSGEGESYISETLKDVEAALPPFVKISYLPSPGVVKLRLTGKGADRQQIEKTLDDFQSQITGILERIVVSLDDIPMQELLGKALLEQNATISLAESCTGGYVAHLITQVQGSSSYFNGAIVPYQSSLKHSIVGVKESTLKVHSAISEETAIELAQ
ncbi:MAG: CinA family nicotinamide mononucleotide deamidase-related protein, partial [Chitinophagaceae bacterium]|nr:CinA family nicotinamide mononucleotide deamidase-related protein [Chitinophagaceae bacterium]